jgi:hypothetical protein
MPASGRSAASIASVRSVVKIEAPNPKGTLAFQPATPAAFARIGSVKTA